MEHEMKLGLENVSFIQRLLKKEMETNPSSTGTYLYNKFTNALIDTLRYRVESAQMELTAFCDRNQIVTATVVEQGEPGLFGDA